MNDDWESQLKPAPEEDWEKHSQEVVAPPLEAVAREGELPLSFAQERLWFLYQMEPENPYYNIPWVSRLEGALDVAALERSFEALVARHEGLRTTFESIDGRPAQVIAPTAPLTLPIH